MVRLASVLTYLGITSVPWLALRIGNGITISDCFFLGAFCCCAAAASVSKVRLPANHAWRLAAFLTVAGAALSLAKAESISGTLASELRILFLLLAWQFAARALLTTDKCLRNAVDCFTVGAALSGVASIGQALGGGFVFGSLVQGRALGLTGHPNDAGGTLCVALVMTIATATSRGLGRRGWRAAAIFLIASGLILSASVTGMLAAAAGTLLLVLSGNLPLRKLILTITAALLALIVGTSVQSRISETDSVGLNPLARFAQTTGAGTAEQNTFETRLATDRAAWSDILNSPLIGRGLDEASSIVIGASLATHNLPLGAWRGGGLLFVLGICVAIGSALHTPSKAARRRNVLEALLLASVTNLIFSMTAPILYQRYFWLPFVLLLAARNSDNRLAKTALSTSNGIDVILLTQEKVSIREHAGGYTQ